MLYKFVSKCLTVHVSLVFLSNVVVFQDLSNDFGEQNSVVTMESSNKSRFSFHCSPSVVIYICV